MNRGRKRKRNAPHGGGRVIAGYGSTTMNPRRKKRKNPRGSVTIVNRGKKNRSQAKHRARRAKSNPGEILSLTLGNPAKRRNKVAARKHRKHHATARRHNTRRRRKNPPVMRNRRRHNIRHHRRRNPTVSGLVDLMLDGAIVIGGMVGSRLLTQMVLGSQNTSFMGYAGNAIAGALIATGVHMATKKPRIVNDVIIGTAAGIAARLLEDFTPIGTYLNQAGVQGVGDYAAGGAHGVGLYLPSNQIWPQRYVDAANSAQVVIPGGWAPTTVVAAGVSGYDTMGRDSLY